MSDEKRGYVKRKRAEDEATTRARIAQAAVDLHGSVGPAFTSISAVAEHAGVRRATVYRHFPDETALFAACSSHWLSQNPLPDLAHLREIGDGKARLVEALDAIYAYYRPNARMLANVIRDAEGSPALRTALEGILVWLKGVETVLREGLAAIAEPDPGLRDAAIAHALSFSAWRVACLDNGLSNETARDMMLRMILPG